MSKETLELRQFSGNYDPKGRQFSEKIVTQGVIENASKQSKRVSEVAKKIPRFNHQLN